MLGSATSVLSRMTRQCTSRSCATWPKTASGWGSGIFKPRKSIQGRVLQWLKDPHNQLQRPADVLLAMRVSVEIERSAMRLPSGPLLQAFNLE